MVRRDWEGYQAVSMDVERQETGRWKLSVHTVGIVCISGSEFL